MSTTKVQFNNRPPAKSWALRIGGAGLLIAAGSVHLDLYLTGYRHIATIGPLFLLQVISAYVLALLILVSVARIWALAGGGFALSTLAGYLLSLWVGMFGFHETRTLAGVVAGTLEIASFAVLFAYAGLGATTNDRDPLHLGMLARRSLLPLATIATLTLILGSLLSVGVSSGPTGSVAASGATGASVKISIMSFSFSPANVVVAPGEKITITNNDSVTHTFTAKPQSHPQGAFGSGDITPGHSVSVTAPTSPGTYAYYCSIHNSMTGTLVVR